MDPSLLGTGVTLLNLKSSGSDLISEMGSDWVGEEDERVRGEGRGLGEGEREEEISVSECWVNRRFFNGVVDSFTRKSSGLFSRFSLQHTTRIKQCRKLFQRQCSSSLSTFMFCGTPCMQLQKMQILYFALL